MVLLMEILPFFSTQLKYFSDYTSKVALRSPIKTIIIWLTNQIAIPKKLGVFLKKYPWWSPVLIKLQGNITEAEHRHEYFTGTFSIFSENPVCRARGNCNAFLVYDRVALLYSLSEPATNRNRE